MNWGGSTYPYSFTPTSAGTPYGAGTGTGTIIATANLTGLTPGQQAQAQPLQVTVTNAFTGTKVGIRDRTTNSSPWVANMRVTSVADGPTARAPRPAFRTTKTGRAATWRCPSPTL